MIPRWPSADSSARPTVVVAHGAGAYDNATTALRSLDLSPVRGKRVLLKPNVGRVGVPGSGITTHPDVVAAAIDVFRDAGAEVAVGESPIVGVRMRDAFEAAGMTSIAGPRDCLLIDMDRRRFVEIPVPGGRVIHSLKACPEVLEFDFVVSVPVMKMHMHTGVSLAVKNMKGCLWRKSKVQLHALPPVEGSHEKPIDIALADLASVLRPSLAIIDGTVGMEGLGPSAGQAKPMDVVVVSSDAFAADAVACQLMGTEARRIPHLRMGAARGYGVVESDRLIVSPDNWRDWISPFAPPPANLTIEFPNITVLDRAACSACQSTLVLFLRRHKDRVFDYFPGRSTLHIAIGGGHKELPEGTLCIGNCTSEHRGVGVFVPGCPPVGSQVLEALSGKPTIDAARGNGSPSDADACD